MTAEASLRAAATDRSAAGPAAPLPSSTGPVEPAVLDEIQRRVLWLATRIVDAANHDRDTGDGVKVGGHQASQRLAGDRDDRALVRATSTPTTGSRSSRTPRRSSTRSSTCSATSTAPT